MIDNRFEQYWRASLTRPRLRYKLVLSAVLHVLVLGLFFGWLNFMPEKKPPEVFRVELMQASEVVSDTAPKKVVEAPAPPPEPTPPPPPPPEPPKPDPPPPEPKVEKKPEPKPVPEKPAPKPKPPEEKPKPPEKKPDPPKPEEKPKPPEKKPEPPKPEEKPKPPEKKPDPPKEKPPEKKPEPPKPEEKPKPPAPAKNQGEITQGVEEAQLPNALRGWAALVQRKVDRNWVLPAGISLGEDGETIKVGFVVASNGDLMDGPTILEGTSQSALDRSCLSAIMAALPLPPFPPDFNEPEQYVVYVFRAIP